MNEGLSRFLGSLAGNVVGRVALSRITQGRGGLGRLEPGRYPHPEYGPVIIPEGAKLDPEKPGEVRQIHGRPPFQIAPWAFLVAYGGLLWYAARTTGAVKDAPLPPAFADFEEHADEAEPLGTKFTEDPYLFPSLKRELQPFEAEDVATSGNPVEACLQRRGWKLSRVEKLKESIAEKQSLDMFSAEEKELTGGEAELLDAIEDCLQRIEKQYGSLEAAGIQIGCPACSAIDEEEEDHG